ncbi:MAG: hypothetical protein JO356_20290 [Acidobacteria bacterium]|nr:hypothetical protein [Acidobacteriota bacterium]
MFDHSGKPRRAWQEIAAEAAKETNREKLQQLSEEMAQSLDDADNICSNSKETRGLKKRKRAWTTGSKQAGYS